MLIERFVLSTSIAIDKSAINLIGLACEKLKDGASTVDDLWPGEPHGLSTLLSDQPIFEKAQKDLWALNEALRAIEKLRSSLNAKIHFLQRTVAPASLHHGLSSVPDEIIERIVYEALHRMQPLGATYIKGECYDWPTMHQKAINKLSQVHRRFRSAVLRMPRKVLYSDSEKKWDTLQLQNTPVCVYGYDGETLGSRIKPIAERLVILTLAYRPRTPQGKFFDFFDVQALPRLEELVIYDGRLEDFLGSCHVPALRRVSTHKIIVEDPRVMDIMPQLTSLSLKDAPLADIAAFAATLAVGKELRHLRLGFNARLDDLRGLLHSEKSYCLPAVEVFGVEVKMSVPFSKIAEIEGGRPVAFLGSLDLPSLHTFDFWLDCSLDQYVTDRFVENVVSCMRNKERLRHLSFGTYNRLTLASLVKSMPGLQSLTLKDVEVQIRGCHLNEIARIRDIQMERCRLDLDIRSFLSRILQQPNAGLRSLKLNRMDVDLWSLVFSDEINRTTHLSDDFYVDLAPGDGELQCRRPHSDDSSDDDSESGYCYQQS